MSYNSAATSNVNGSGTAMLVSELTSPGHVEDEGCAVSWFSDGRRGGRVSVCCAPGLLVFCLFRTRHRKNKASALSDPGPLLYCLFPALLPALFLFIGGVANSANDGGDDESVKDEKFQSPGGARNHYGRVCSASAVPAAAGAKLVCCDAGLVVFGLFRACRRESQLLARCDADLVLPCFLLAPSWRRWRATYFTAQATGIVTKAMGNTMPAVIDTGITAGRRMRLGIDNDEQCRPRRAETLGSYWRGAVVVQGGGCSFCNFWRACS